MNDEEKTFEAFRIIDIAYETTKEYREQVLERFRKGTRFPYFNRVVFDDDRNNRWYLTFMCKSKKEAKAGLFYTFCYTIYDIPKKKKDGNGGKGFLCFEPTSMHRRKHNNECEGLYTFLDFVPHLVNRYTERYLKPQGKENEEFIRKVEDILYRWFHFDIEGDKSSEKHKDKGDIPYDVFMNDGSMLRGNLVDDWLIRFFTYIDKDMLFDAQKERFAQMAKERWNLIRQGYYVNKAKELSRQTYFNC